MTEPVARCAPGDALRIAHDTTAGATAGSWHAVKGPLAMFALFLLFFVSILVFAVAAHRSEQARRADAAAATYPGRQDAQKAQHRMQVGASR